MKKLVKKNTIKNDSFSKVNLYRIEAGNNCTCDNPSWICGDNCVC